MANCCWSRQQHNAVRVAAEAFQGLRSSTRYRPPINAFQPTSRTNAPPELGSRSLGPSTMETTSQFSPQFPPTPVRRSPALVTSLSGALSSYAPRDWTAAPLKAGASDATLLWFVVAVVHSLPWAPKQVLLAQLSLLWRELPLLHAS
jgi:hypothetical protein